MKIFYYLPDLILMILFYACYLHRRWKNTRPYALFFFYLCACFIFLVTLSPFITSLPHILSGEIGRYNFNPFVDLLNGYGNPLQECLENIILFVPFAFTYRYATHSSFAKTLFLGILFSLFIETIQPLISFVRVFDVTDMITNTCGTCIGAFIYTIYLHFQKKRSS